MKVLFDRSWGRTGGPRCGCRCLRTSPRIRRAWCVAKTFPASWGRRSVSLLSALIARHTLQDNEKKAHIDAELCLISTPALLRWLGFRLAGPSGDHRKLEVGRPVPWA